MKFENWLQAAALVAACAALAACGGDRAAPAGADTGAPSPQVAPAVPGTEVARQVAAANSAFDAGRFVAPPGDNALEWFAAARESDPAHPGVVEAVVDLYPIALAATERALADGDTAEALRIVDLLDRAQPGSLGTRRLRERLRAPETVPARETATAGQPPAPDAPSPNAATIEQPQPTPPEPPAAPPAATAAASASPPPAVEPAAPEPDPAPAQRAAEAPMTAAQPPAEAFSPPRAVSRVEPAYPQLARQRRIEGWVELEFLVGADGTPREIEVVESNPNAIFDSAATRALQRWRFEPARRGATVEAARSRTRITFRLGRARRGRPEPQRQAIRAGGLRPTAWLGGIRSVIGVLGSSTALSMQSAGQAEVAQGPCSTRFEGPAAGWVACRAVAERFRPPFRAQPRQRAEHNPAGSSPHRVRSRVLPRAPRPAERHAAAAGGSRGPGRSCAVSSAPCLAKWAMMARIGLGSSMLATIRTAPPQWTQVSAPMLNTRLRRCAQVIDRRRSSGERSSVLVEFDSASMPAACRAARASTARAGWRPGQRCRGSA